MIKFVLIVVAFLILFPSQIQGSFNSPPPPIVTPSTTPQQTDTSYGSPVGVWYGSLYGSTQTSGVGTGGIGIGQTSPMSPSLQPTLGPVTGYECAYGYVTGSSGCVYQPMPVYFVPPPVPTIAVIPVNAISWETPNVSLKADNFNILIHNLSTNEKKYFFGKSSDMVSNVTLHSEPGNKSYTTLEAAWHENGVEMKMNMYFNVKKGRWHLYEIRTYDGKDPANWVFYGELSDKTTCGDELCGTPLGSPFVREFASIGPDPNNPLNTTYMTINFENVRLHPFLNLKYIPTISKISSSKAHQGARVALTGLNFSDTTKVYVGDALMPEQFYTLSEDGLSLSFILSTETPFKINQKYEVYVSNENGQSNKTFLTVTSPAVLRTSNPTSANFGQIMLLTGSGFGYSTGSVVFISPNGSYAGGAPILSWKDKSIVLRIPAVAGNTPYQLQVNMGNQPEGKIAHISNTIPFTVQAGQPYVASIAPSNAKPGKMVTIEGTELGTKPGRVKFITSAKKIIPATIYFWSETKVQFTIPKITSNLDYAVQIVTADGRESSVTFYHVGK